MHPVPWRAYALLAASTSLVGSYVGLSKLLVAAFPVFLLAGLRFGIAAVLMLPWLHKPADEAPLDGRARLLLFLESFLGNFLFSICMLFGLRQSSAVVAGVIMAGIPAAVALLSWAFLRERPSGRVLAGIACAVGASRSWPRPSRAAPRPRWWAPCYCSRRCSARAATWSSARR